MTISTMAAIHRIVELNRERRRLRRPRSRYAAINAGVRARLNPLDHLTDGAIIDRYRLPRAEIMSLLALLEVDLARKSRRNFALSPTVQLLTALRFHATGGFQQTMGDGHGLSKSAVSRAVHAVNTALLAHAPTFIKLPRTREQIRGENVGFLTTGGIPLVIGAVDGTLIPILTPSLHDPIYTCRKGYSALNIQVICDHQGKFTDVVARWPGSTHDSFVWANSAVCQLAMDGEFGGGWLLGDSGYPLRPYLLTPVGNPQTISEMRYNSAHIRTRSLVERSIGIWKMRFRCIHKSAGGLRFAPGKCCAVVVVTAMLHNIAVRSGVPLPMEQEVEEEEEENNIPAVALEQQRREAHQAGLEARRQLIENVFT